MIDHVGEKQKDKLLRKKSQEVIQLCKMVKILLQVVFETNSIEN